MGVQSPAEHAFNLMAESMSSEVSEAIRQELDRVVTSRPAGLLSAAVLATVVLGASGRRLGVEGHQPTYDLHERRPLWKRWLLGLGLALLAEGVLAAGLAMLVGAQAIGHVAAISPGPPHTFWLVAAFSSWPLILSVLLLQAALVTELRRVARFRGAG